MKAYIRLIALLLPAVLLCGCGGKDAAPSDPDDGGNTPDSAVVVKDSASVVCSDGSRTLRFRRGGDGAWQWVDDVSFPLDGQFVDELISLTQELDALAPVSNPEPPEYYGLVNTSRYLAIRRLNGSEVVYRIGNQTEDGGYYCNSSDDEEVIRIAPERILTLMGRSIYDMAQLPRLPELTVKEIKSVTITRGDRTDHLTLSREKWMRDKTDVSDESAVTRLELCLPEAALLKCADYDPAEGAAEVCGLAPPAAVMEIELAKTTLKLRVGAFNSFENAWYVALDDDTTIYLMTGELPALLAEWPVGE